MRQFVVLVLVLAGIIAGSISIVKMPDERIRIQIRDRETQEAATLRTQLSRDKSLSDSLLTASLACFTTALAIGSM